MSNWRVAEGLLRLRDQVNAKFPNRSKESDGTIGDAEHATRDSDHNPWVRDSKGVPVVTAMDITHDPKNGFDSYAFADMLLKNKDSRIKYVISNRRIASGTDQENAAWKWRKYTGSNPHDHHVHISLKSGQQFYDSKVDWKVDNFGVSGAALATFVPPPPTVRQGSTGEVVKKVQGILDIPQTGEFDLLTFHAVRAWQAIHKLSPDGIVGPQTWKSMGE